jgi:hypothetical protein
MIDAIDQYGSVVHLGDTTYPRKALLAKLYAKHAEKIYVDKTNGTVAHIGYIVQGRWFTLYNVTQWEGRT